MNPSVVDDVRSEDALIELASTGRGDPEYQKIFEALLRESHPVYDGRGAAAISRMRGWLLLALGDGDLPDSALPFVLEELESAHDAYLTAAAAYVLRRARPRAEYVPPLLSALFYLRYRDDAVDLTEYGGYGTGGAHTTGIAEILETLGWLGPLARTALPRLRELRREDRCTPGVAGRLEDTISRLESAAPGDAAPEPAPAAGPCCCSGGDPRSDRDANATPEPPSIADVRLQDQDGELLRFGEFFFGRPSIVVFFYTRCDNPTKCALTVTRLGRMQRRLRDRGLGAAVRTGAITYDPAFDLPPRLKRYAATWGATPDENHKMLRTVDELDPLRSYFDLGVNYVSSLVNRHRIEAFVLDSEGGIHHAATRLQWDAAALVDRAAALLT